MTTKSAAVISLLVASLWGCSGTAPSERATESAPEIARNAKQRVIQLHIDSQGHSVGDIEVATFWSANGQQWLDDGNAPELRSDDAISEFWDDEGQMMPNPNRIATRVSDGVFELKTARPHVVYAIDSKRKFGGLAQVLAESDEQLKIKLEPLVRVHGEIRFQGKVPQWSYACFFPGGATEVPD